MIPQRIEMLEDRHVDPARILQNYPALKPSKGSHESGKNLHNTDKYEFQLDKDGNIFLNWSYCPSCQVFRYKYVVGMDKTESIAYVKDYIVDGRKVE